MHRDKNGHKCPKPKAMVKMVQCTICRKPHELRADQVVEHQREVRRLEARRASGVRARAAV